MTQAGKVTRDEGDPFRTSGPPSPSRGLSLTVPPTSTSSPGPLETTPDIWLSTRVPPIPSDSGQSSRLPGSPIGTRGLGGRE